MNLRTLLAAGLSLIAGIAVCSGVLSLDQGGGWRLDVGPALGLVLLAASPIGGAALLAWWNSQDSHPPSGVWAMVLSFVLGLYLLFLAEWIITTIVEHPEINWTPIFVMVGVVLVPAVAGTIYRATR